MHRRWRSFSIRVLIASVLAWMLATVALPRIPPHLWVADVFVPIVVFILICYIGKLVIDTLFYNHYNP